MKASLAADATAKSVQLARDLSEARAAHEKTTVQFAGTREQFTSQLTQSRAPFATQLQAL